MTIRFTCSECASVLKIKDELAGTKGKCPKCKTPFVVPSLAVEDPSSEMEVAVSHKSAKEISSSNDDSLLPPASLQPTAPAPLSLPDDEPPLALPDDDEPAAPVSHSHNNHTVEEEEEEEVRPSADIKSMISPPLSDEIDEDSREIMSEDIDFLSSQELPSSTTESNRASLGFDDDDDLDSPPVLADGPFGLSSSEIDIPKPVQAPAKPKKDPSAFEIAVKKEPQRGPKGSSPVSSDSGFDPYKFLMTGSADIGQFTPPTKPNAQNIQHDSDLNLDDSDFEMTERPTPFPVSQTPAPRSMSKGPAPKAGSEKVDAASAAKMMRKVIKDAQSDAVRQRHVDAKPGYDYFLFFREIGFRGLGIIGGCAALVFVAIFVGNYIVRSVLKTPDLTLVRGTIKLDGQPLANATIYFAPKEIKAISGTKKERARTSIGVSNDKGEFKMMYSPADRIEGVTAGQNRVWVTHLGAKGDDTPSKWSEFAMREADIPKTSAVSTFDINMDSEKKK